MNTARQNRNQSHTGHGRVEIEELLRKSLPRLTPRPCAVDGIDSALISLNGTWRFNPSPADSLPAGSAAGAGWNDITVPGEWAMQGFTVKPDMAAGYMRTFTAPADWTGKRIKLRFDNVYSLCKVWVNGNPVGEHEGGFIPFEFDITAAVTPGANTLALTVQNESLADRMASGSQYAAHSLGGIARKVQLFAVPALNVSDLKIATRFDGSFKDAVVQARLTLANDGAAISGRATVRVVVRAADGQTLASAERSVPAIEPGQGAVVSLELPVPEPRKWDSEHPNLHTLACELDSGERVEERFGFRQVEVRGNRVLLNGQPIKWRGVCRHEAHPLLGRALNDELWRQDAELYRAMNCNIIRTAHYPPAEEFIRHCDELGIFVELEAALCWVQHGANKLLTEEDLKADRFFFLLLQANLAAVQGYANHPSVIVRSLANESRWSDAFETVARCMALADPTRVLCFHDQCWGTFNNAGSRSMPLANFHYPGLDGPAQADEGARPAHFGEYCHISTYNRREIVTDPAVREDYGRALLPMCDRMYRSPGTVGGTLWSGIDDVFLLPDGRAVGYGEWGPMDGWRRLKPESWHIKKCYSPVRVEEKPLALPAEGQPLVVPVENRFNFTDLNEIRIEWDWVPPNSASDDESSHLPGAGTPSSRPPAWRNLQAALPPRQAGHLAIPVNGPVKAGARLRLRFTDARGVIVDEYALTVGATVPPKPGCGASAIACCTLVEAGDTWTVKAGDCIWSVDRKSGLLRSGAKGQTAVVTGGPHLLMLPLTNGGDATEDRKDRQPLTDVCADWAAQSVAAWTEGNDVLVEANGRYGDTAGKFRLTFHGDGGLKVMYEFGAGADIDPRQWGIVFDVAGACGELEWDRTAQWSCYPAGHLGRPRGMATSELAGRRGDSRQPPAWPWELDENELGSNDFRATRTGVHWVTLCNATGAGLRVEGGGRQATRVWRHGDGLRLLVAGFHTGGADGYLSVHYAAERKPLKKGDIVSDTVNMRIVGQQIPLLHA